MPSRYAGSGQLGVRSSPVRSCPPRATSGRITRCSPKERLLFTDDVVRPDVISTSRRNGVYERREREGCRFNRVEGRQRWRQTTRLSHPVGRRIGESPSKKRCSRAWRHRDRDRDDCLVRRHGSIHGRAGSLNYPRSRARLYRRVGPPRHSVVRQSSQLSLERNHRRPD